MGGWGWNVPVLGRWSYPVCIVVPFVSLLSSVIGSRREPARKGGAEGGWGCWAGLLRSGGASGGGGRVKYSPGFGLRLPPRLSSIRVHCSGLMSLPVVTVASPGDNVGLGGGTKDRSGHTYRQR